MPFKHPQSSRPRNPAELLEELGNTHSLSSVSDSKLAGAVGNEKWKGPLKGNRRGWFIGVIPSFPADLGVSQTASRQTIAGLIGRK